MRLLMKFIAVLVAAAGVVALVLVYAPSVSGQRGLPPDRMHDMMLPWGGAEVGVSVREADTGGVVIEDVREGSPAEKAGLKRGDTIVEFDGERVRSVRQFTRLVNESAPDRPVKLAVQRDGKRTDLQVTPIARSANFSLDVDRLRLDADRIRQEAQELAGELPYPFESERGRLRLGATVQPLTDQLATYFGVKGGVLVSSVADDSPAAKAGVKAGDVITAIDGAPVRSRGDLLRGLRDAGNADVTLTVVRDRKEMTVKATVERHPRTTMRDR